jgi:hypothetical protein
MALLTPDSRVTRSVAAKHPPAEEVDADADPLDAVTTGARVGMGVGAMVGGGVGAEVGDMSTVVDVVTPVAPYVVRSVVSEVPLAALVRVVVMSVAVAVAPLLVTA